MAGKRTMASFLGTFCVLFFLVFSLAVRTGACQIAEPAEPAPQQSMQNMHGMHGHHMNVPMGEETCAPKYTYDDGPSGPSHWQGLCNTGKLQAPIDIEHAEKLPIQKLRFLYQPADLDLINDCNQYRILARFPDNDWLTVGKTPYFFSELHFRAPGENAIDGKRPRMSVQLVHLSPESKFLIVEVPVVAGKENPAMKTLLQHVPAPGKENKLDGVKIDPTDFLPADRTVFRFTGSLTTPICNQETLWYVMKNSIEFSEAQIAEYTKYYRDTARPLQPLNGRQIAESQ
jgi:carbonic anhydrase